MTVIKAFVSGEVAHLMISGRLVHGEGAEAAIQRTLHRCSGSHFDVLLVDLRDVGKMDAVGISALLVVYHAAQSLGARFQLANVPRRIHELLFLTRLDTVFFRADQLLTAETSGHPQTCRMVPTNVSVAGQFENTKQETKTMDHATSTNKGVWEAINTYGPPSPQQGGESSVGYQTRIDAFNAQKAADAQKRGS